MYTLIAIVIGCSTLLSLRTLLEPADINAIGVQRDVLLHDAWPCLIRNDQS